MGPAPIFIGNFKPQIKRSLMRRLSARGVRFFLRRKNMILAYTAMRREIYITIVRDQVRSINFWFHEDAISPRALLEFRKLRSELAAIIPA